MSADRCRLVPASLDPKCRKPSMELEIEVAAEINGYLIHRPVGFELYATGWKVTHALTGLAFPLPAMATKRQARKLIDLLNEHLPELRNRPTIEGCDSLTRSPVGMQAHRKIMEALAADG